MNSLLKSISALVVSFSAASALAAPQFLTTHNHTDVESNAFVAGTIPSIHPTPAHQTRDVYWNMVRLACYGNMVDGRCPALIMMATDTNNPIALGWVYMDLDTGDISPKYVTGGGYTITVNGPGEATVTKN